MRQRRADKQHEEYGSQRGLHEVENVTILIWPSGGVVLKKHSYSVAAAQTAALVLFVALVAGVGGAAQQAPAGAVPPPGQGARGGGRGPAPVNTLGTGPWDLGTGRSRVHVTLYAKDLDHPWGIAFLPDGGMLVTERPGRLRVIRNGVLDPDADRPTAGDACAQSRWTARRLTSSALCREPAHLSHLLEAWRRREQRDHGRVSCAMGRWLDTRRRQGHPRRQRVPRRTRAAIRAWARPPAATVRESRGIRTA